MADTNAKIINYFSMCGHCARLYEITHPLYTEPRYVFTDEVLTPKEKDDGYDFEFNLSYISKVYDNKEEAESKFDKLRYAYLFDAHAMIPDEDDEYKKLTVIPLRSDLCEKYMDSIMDKIVTITSFVRADKDNLNDYEAGFSIDFEIKFKINDIEFIAEAYTVYGDCTDGENPNVNIIIFKGDKIAAFIDDTFNSYDNLENGEKFIIKSDNRIAAINIGSLDVSIHKCTILEDLNINLISLGRFFLNKVYQGINDIISKLDQKA